MTLKNDPMEMVREGWDRLPHFDPPQGYSLRWFQPGDESHWLNIQKASEPYREITPDLFQQQFGPAFDLLPQRQVFLMDNSGAHIATGTAWFDNHFRGERYGRVHWIAVRPEFQGKGLGKVILSAVCERLRDLGHERVFLRTSAARLAAIRLYMQFGFQPLLRQPKE